MSEWSIQLQTASLNRTFFSAKEHLTRVLDGLALLETETAKLSENWQGEGFRQWETEMESCLEEAAAEADKFKQFIVILHQCAASLAGIEQEMTQQAKGW